MNSAPRDGTWILVGLWIRHNDEPELRWEQYVGSYNSVIDNDLPWSWEDFDAWTVIPKPPHWGKE